MEAASKIIFNDDEYIDAQAAALKCYLHFMEVHTVNMGAKGGVHLYCYTSASGIIHSGAGATFLTSIDKKSNALKHKAQLKSANVQACFTTRMGK